MEIIKRLDQLNSQTEEKIKDDLLFSSTNLAVTVSAKQSDFLNFGYITGSYFKMTSVLT